MKSLLKTVLTIGAVLALQGMALSAEQSGEKGSSKTFAQTVEEIRNSINEGWRKLTSPKTTEPARDEINKAWKELSDAAGAAVGSTSKSQKDTGDKKDK